MFKTKSKILLSFSTVFLDSLLASTRSLIYLAIAFASLTSLFRTKTSTKRHFSNAFKRLSLPQLLYSSTALSSSSKQKSTKDFSSLFPINLRTTFSKQSRSRLLMKKLSSQLKYSPKQKSLVALFNEFHCYTKLSFNHSLEPCSAPEDFLISDQIWLTLARSSTNITSELVISSIKSLCPFRRHL